MSNKKNKNRNFRIAITGILAALALSLSFIERLLIALFPLPMGIKPGFSNIIVMFACTALGAVPAFGIAVIKALFAALVSGISSGFISLCGGLLSVTAILITNKMFSDKVSYIGISVLSAVMHNIGQTAAASVIAGSSLFLAYIPVLLISGAAFGTVTGIILNVTLPYLTRLKISDSEKLK